jgi:hypothetical protein
LSGRTSRAILNPEEQALGLTWTPSIGRLEAVRKKAKATGYSPQGKILTSLKRMKSRCSSSWLASEKERVKVQLSLVCFLGQKVSWGI